MQALFLKFTMFLHENKFFVWQSCVDDGTPRKLHAFRHKASLFLFEKNCIFYKKEIDRNISDWLFLAGMSLCCCICILFRKFANTVKSVSLACDA